MPYLNEHEHCDCRGEECIACLLGRTLSKVAADIHRLAVENQAMRAHLNIAHDADVGAELARLKPVPMCLHVQDEDGEWLPAAEGRIEDGRAVHAVVELPDGHMGERGAEGGMAIVAAFRPRQREAGKSR